MSSLRLDRRSTSTSSVRATDPPLPLIVAGGLAGAAASLLCLVALVVPALVAWLLAPGVDQSLAQVMQVAGGAWLAGQGVPVVVAAIHVTLLPLGFGLLSAAMLVMAGRWAARASAVARPGEALAVAGSGAVVYAVIAAVVAALAHDLSIPPMRALVTCGALSFVILTLAVLRACGLMELWWGGVRYQWRDMAAAASVALAMLAGAAVLLLVVALVLRGAALGSAWSALGIDASGSLLIIMLSLGYLPTAIVWSLSYMLGGGFAVTAGAVVSPFVDSAPGGVPAFPLLAAVPDSAPLLAKLLPFVAVLAGAAAGLLLRRRGYVGARGVMVSAGSALLSAIVVGLACVAATGSVGVERLAGLGPRTVMCALVAAVAVCAGAALVTIRQGREREGSESVEVDHG